MRSRVNIYNPLNYKIKNSAVENTSYYLNFIKLYFYYRYKFEFGVEFHRNYNWVINKLFSETVLKIPLEYIISCSDRLGFRQRRHQIQMCSAGEVPNN